jgi:hypothetical protein
MLETEEIIMNGSFKVMFCSMLYFLIISGNSLLFAGIYKWTDTDGTVHFSDNPQTISKKMQSLEQDENNLKSPNSSNRKFYSESNTSPKDSCQKPVMDSNCTTMVLRKYVPPECQNRPVSNEPPQYDAVCDKAINSSQARVELDQCITGWKIDAECKRLMEINGLYSR